MLKCQYCGKETKSTSGLTYHTRRCMSNPNRIEYFWSGKVHSNETKKKIGQSLNLEKIPENIFDVSPRTRLKILKRLAIGCSNCGWNEAACDIHHIVPKSMGGTNDHDNLTYICPNCHRLAHTGILTSFTSFQNQIKDIWKENYYG